MFQLLRVQQYIKNTVIFAPMFFSFHISLEQTIHIFIAFCLFSCTASSIYIFNDLMDIEQDKAHPTKKYRPIACGEVSIYKAKTIMLALITFSLLSAYFFNTNLFYVLCSYLSINILYSIKLKHIGIIDIFTIASGFVLRLFAGSLVIHITLSMWIIIITFLLAIFLALAKRRDDVLLNTLGKETRKNISFYNLEFINAAMVLMSAVVIVSYIQYTVSDHVMDKLNTHYLYLTTFFVILGIMRYMQITFVTQKSGNPTKILLEDNFLKITILSWIFSFIFIVKIL